MLAAQAHRAPHRKATWVRNPVVLAHGLMRVTFEDDYDVQPLRDPVTGSVIVADIRLDNREALAATLGIGRAVLEQTPDSAVALAAYGRWGDACVDHLVGDFALAVWDERAGRLFLARDHTGQRGLHIHRSEDFVAFATDVAGVVALPAVPRVLSEATIARRLLWARDWPAGATHLEGVDCLGAGRCLSLGVDGDAVERVYWTPSAGLEHLNRSEAYYVDTYRRVLEEAVACRIRRLTRPAALAMSGGFDSAAIAGLAAPHLKGRKLVTVTVAAPAAEAEADDPRPWVDTCARHMPHLDVRYFEAVAGADQKLDRAFLEADGPAAAPHHNDRGLFELARAAGARVFMDGMGGDYTLNPRGVQALAHWLRSGRLRRFVAEFRAFGRVTGMSPWRIFRRRLWGYLLPLPIVRWRQWRRRGGQPLWRLRMATPAFADAVIAAGVVRSVYDPARAPRSAREESLDILRARQAFPPPERAIAAARYGLVHTRPFHDKRVVELALAIPEDLHVRDGFNRALARQALADVYPPEFQSRGWDQTAGAPGFHQSVLVARERLLDEIGRLESKPRLSRYFNFSSMREIIELPDVERFGQALNAILLAQYVERFAGDNSAAASQDGL
jgi:asparagine synthase (glutamine-hydrolysing)